MSALLLFALQLATTEVCPAVPRTTVAGALGLVESPALVPSGVDNLLVAGRSVAGDQISHASVRNMMCCTVTGQGAGVAAAVSVKKGVSAAAVPIEDIRRELKRQGVRFV